MSIVYAFNSFKRFHFNLIGIFSVPKTQFTLSADAQTGDFNRISNESIVTPDYRRINSNVPTAFESDRIEFF